MVHVYRAFSDSIIDLDREEVKSEYQRSSLLILLFSLILVIAISNFILLHDTIVQFYGGFKTFFAIVVGLCIFLFYELLVLFYLRVKLYQRNKTSLAFKIIHTMIEISFPSTIMVYHIGKFGMLSFIDSPVSLTYFLFIILSILHLDYRVSLLTGALAAVQYVIITYYGFNHVDIAPRYIPSAPENSHHLRAVILFFCGGAAAFVSAGLKSRIKSTYENQQAKDELKSLFGQHVSKEVSKALIEEKGVTKRLEATVMFLDIRNFTSFADTHTADEVIDYQNKFLAPVIDLINQNQGVVFQILGDGLMACFGSPVENVLHADVAFQASIQILQKVNSLSESGEIPYTKIGIGLHSGLLIAGNIGNEQRKQFSISGTPVIVASRLEQLNKKYGTEFLISEEVLNRISVGKTSVDYLGEEPIRGFEKPVKVYSISA